MRDHYDAGKRQADGKHHHEHADDLGDGGDELRHGLVEALTQCIDIVGDAREHVTLAVAVEVAHGDDGDLLGDLLAHAVADLLRDARHEPALDKVACRASEVEAQQEQQRLADPVEIDRAGALDLGDQALEELGGYLAQDLGANDVEDDRRHGEGGGKEHGDLVATNVAQKLEHSALEVFGLLDHAAWSAPAHGACGPSLALGHFGLAHIVCH